MFWWDSIGVIYILWTNSASLNSFLLGCCPYFWAPSWKSLSPQNRSDILEDESPNDDPSLALNLMVVISSWISPRINVKKQTWQTLSTIYPITKSSVYVLRFFKYWNFKLLSCVRAICVDLAQAWMNKEHLPLKPDSMEFCWLTTGLGSMFTLRLSIYYVFINNGINIYCIQYIYIIHTNTCNNMYILGILSISF